MELCPSAGSRQKVVEGISHAQFCQLQLPGHRVPGRFHFHQILSLSLVLKTNFQGLQGGKDHDFPSILVSWLLVSGGSDLEDKSPF